MATARGEYRFTVKGFTVKEDGDGVPWLAAQPKSDRRLDGLLGLELRPGTTIEQARNLAQILNEHVVAISLTWSAGVG